jgi:putative zinc finger protein
MNCREAARRLPGYLDGAISTREHARLRVHLSQCAVCRGELERYRLLMGRLARVEPIAPPADLAVRIRWQAARTVSLTQRVHRLWERAQLAFKNVFRPLAVPATGGILTALVVFVFVVQSMLVGVPLGGVVPNDLPLNLVQPARLESLAPFPVPGIESADGRSSSNLLLVEATLNAQGQVVSFRILSGPSGPEVERQLDQVLLFSRFRPRFSFGRPTDGGRVLLSFSEVQVRG